MTKGKLFIATLVIAIAALGWYYYQSERQEAAAIEAKNNPILYRWADDEGVTHISPNPPPKKYKYSVVTIDPDQNILPSKPN